MIIIVIIETYLFQFAISKKWMQWHQFTCFLPFLVFVIDCVSIFLGHYILVTGINLEDDRGTFQNPGRYRGKSHVSPVAVARTGNLCILYCKQFSQAQNLAVWELFSLSFGTPWHRYYSRHLRKGARSRSTCSEIKFLKFEISMIIGAIK